MGRPDLQLRSLVAATDIDTLPDSAVVVDRGEYIVVRSPSNPAHYWGNFLLFRDAPPAGVREAWEEHYEREFGSDRESRHCAITWDRPDGELGAAVEFEAAGYDVDAAVALVAESDELVAHPRANAEVTIRQLDPHGDEELWQAAIDVQVENRDEGHEVAFHTRFVERRMADRRARFRRGDGAWFVAVTPEGDAVAGCGVIVTDGRARFQAVDTVERARRRGIASRLVYEAGRAALDRFGAQRLVIVADPGYHALPLYRSLGFVERHRSIALCWWPGAPRAHAHPRWGHLARRAD